MDIIVAIRARTPFLVYYRAMQILKRWTLFKISGIPVCLDLSVALLVAYLIYVYFDAQYPILTFLVGLYVAAGLLISILLHELTHSLFVIVFGGRVRDITLQLLGGCAMIARMPPRPVHECVIALAGPVCSLLLAVNLWWIASFFTHYGFWFEILAVLNLGLAFFNLIPAFPMDGGRILRSLLQCFGKTKLAATEIATAVGRSFAAIWVVSAIVNFLGFPISEPAGMPWWFDFLWGIVLGDGGIFRLLIAYMIWTASAQELAYVRAEADYYGGWR